MKNQPETPLLSVAFSGFRFAASLLIFYLALPNPNLSAQTILPPYDGAELSTISPPITERGLGLKFALRADDQQLNTVLGARRSSVEETTLHQRIVLGSSLISGIAARTTDRLRIPLLVDESGVYQVVVNLSRLGYTLSLSPAAVQPGVTEFNVVSTVTPTIRDGETYIANGMGIAYHKPIPNTLDFFIEHGAETIVDTLSQRFRPSLFLEDRDAAISAILTDLDEAIAFDPAGIAEFLADNAWFPFNPEDDLSIPVHGVPLEAGRTYNLDIDANTSSLIATFGIELGLVIYDVSYSVDSVELIASSAPEQTQPAITSFTVSPHEVPVGSNTTAQLIVTPPADGTALVAARILLDSNRNAERDPNDSLIGIVDLRSTTTGSARLGSSLSPGFHILFAEALDEKDRVSLPVPTHLYIALRPPNPASSIQLLDIEISDEDRDQVPEYGERVDLRLLVASDVALDPLEVSLSSAPPEAEILDGETLWWNLPANSPTLSTGQIALTLPPNEDGGSVFTFAFSYEIDGQVFLQWIPRAIPLFPPYDYGSLLAYEGFDYQSRSLTGQGGGLGWGTAWTDGTSPSTCIVESPGLAIGGFASSGNHLLCGGQNAGSFRSLSANEPGFDSLYSNGKLGRAGTTLWLSFILDVVEYPSDFVRSYAGLSLYDGESERLFLGLPWQGGTNDQSRSSIKLGLHRHQGNIPFEGGAVSTAATQVMKGDTFLFVARMQFDVNGVQDRVDVFLYEEGTDVPAAPGEPDIVTLGQAFDFQFNRIRIQSGAPENVRIGVDEIRLGTSFASVTPKQNQPPTDLLLLSPSIEENSPAGTVIGELVVIDGDIGDVHRLEIISGNSDLFSIEGRNLVSRVELDFEEQSTHLVIIRITDLGGLTATNAVWVHVIDLPEEPPLSLPVSQLELSSEYHEGVEIAVESNTTWTWSTDADWITTDEAEQQVGDGTFTFSVSEHFGREVRVAEILFSAGELTEPLRVTQLGADPYISLNGLSDQDPAFTVSREPQNLGVLVSSNSAWEWSASESWVSSGHAIAQEGELFFSFVVDRNEGLEEREASLMFSAADLSRTILIRQAGGGMFDFEAQVLRVLQGGGEYEVEVDSNSSWSWSSGADWISSSEDATQSGPQLFSFVVSEFNGFGSRNGIIEFEGDGFEGDIEVSQIGFLPDFRVKRTGNGMLKIEFVSISGFVFRLETSLDLLDWTEVETIDGNGGWHTLDIPADNESRRFYRVSAGGDQFEDGGEVTHFPVEYVFIREGTFTMGSPLDEMGRREDEEQFQVTLTRPFYLKATEVTWAEWIRVLMEAERFGYTDIGGGRNGGEGEWNETHPVTNVSWWDVVKWCNLKSEVEGKTPVYYTEPGFVLDSILRNGTPMVFPDWSATGYRLPTEAEWEYACRAGTTTAFHSGPINQTGATLDPSLDRAGWYILNSRGGSPNSVGRKERNEYGLFDMHGNVEEWCWDSYGPYPETAAVDPRGYPWDAPGSERVVRGGSSHLFAECCRSASRIGFDDVEDWYNGVGFRPALTSSRLDGNSDNSVLDLEVLFSAELEGGSGLFSSSFPFESQELLIADATISEVLGGDASLWRTYFDEPSNSIFALACSPEFNGERCAILRISREEPIPEVIIDSTHTLGTLRDVNDLLVTPAGFLFWCGTDDETGAGVINRADLNGNSKSEILRLEDFCIYFLSGNEERIAFLGDELYEDFNELTKVLLLDHDGSNLETLFVEGENAASLRGILLSGNDLYWLGRAELFSDLAIYRTNLISRQTVNLLSVKSETDSAILHSSVHPWGLQGGGGARFLQVSSIWVVDTLSIPGTAQNSLGFSIVDLVSREARFFPLAMFLEDLRTGEVGFFPSVRDVLLLWER